jgi:enoyl-CoA hydratase/carnithine racemase
MGVPGDGDPGPSDALGECGAVASASDPPVAVTLPAVPRAPDVRSPVDLPPALARSLAEASLALELTGRRADVVLSAPQRRNPQTPATWRALAAVTEWLDARADVVVLRADGPSFSAGLDRRAFTLEGVPGELALPALAALDDDRLDATIAEYQRGFAGWGRAGFVSIAAVQGHAVGAGFQLALACDLRIAADDALFAMREPALGLVPDLGGTKALVDAVGYPRALEICATSRFVTAAESLAYGLVQQVVAPGELPAAVDRLAQALLAGDAAAIRATRALLRDAGSRDPEAQRAAERRAQLVCLRRLAGRSPAS